MWLRRALRVAIVTLLCSSVVQAQSTGVREISASDRSLIPLTTKVRYTTMILLPEEEEILDVVCGDRDFWIISATQNIAHVKPAKEHASTNLNLVTSSGAVYSFLLTEEKTAPTDLKVYVTNDSPAKTGSRRYYSAQDVNALQAELASAQAAIDTTRHAADETIAAFKQQYPATLEFPYETPKYQKPFLIRSIWHDGQFTYIRSEARELPALYEIQDGKPALLNFQVRNGVYIVPKVLERGYLALGKTRFEFRQGR